MVQERDFRSLQRDFLAEQGLMSPPNLQPLGASERLQLLTDANVTLDGDSAGNIFSELVEAGDKDEEIKFLHENGEGHALLAKTTLYLFHRQLDTDCNPQPDTPKKELEKLVNRNLRRRASIDRHGDTFVETLVEEKETGLHSLCEQGGISEEEAVEMERWLINKMPIPKREKDSLLESLESWLIERWARETDTSIESFESGIQQKIVERRVDYLLDKGSFDKALELFRQQELPAQEQMIRNVARELVRHHKEEVGVLLNEMRERIHQADLPADEKEKSLLGLVYPYVLAVDTEGITQTLDEADQEGHQQLCYDLGVSPEQLSLLFIYADLNGEGSLSPNFYTLDGLLKGEYKEGSFTTDRGSLEYESYNYASLLVPRIVIFGEEGINYPDNLIIAETYELVTGVAEALHKRGDWKKLEQWLKCIEEFREEYDGRGTSSVSRILEGRY